MRIPGQLKATVRHLHAQLWVGACRSRNHNGEISHLQQGKIIGRITKGQHLHTGRTNALSENIQRSSLADVGTEEVTHPVTPNDCQTTD